MRLAGTDHLAIMAQDGGKRNDHLHEKKTNENAKWSDTHGTNDTCRDTKAENLNSPSSKSPIKSITEMDGSLVGPPAFKAARDVLTLRWVGSIPTHLRQNQSYQ